MYDSAELPPDAGCTWLLTEIDPEETDIAFGLCDLGLGFPELGYVSITELISVHGRFGLPVERDRHFKASTQSAFMLMQPIRKSVSLRRMIIYFNL